MTEGRIIKSLSGFYTVKTDSAHIVCKGRGVFRKRKVTPLVGDKVTITLNEDQTTGTITEIAERTNSFVRPPIANMTQAIVVVSAKEPDFSSLLLDRFLVNIAANNIEPIILITKADLLSEAEVDEIKAYQADYKRLGYQTYLTSLAGEDLSFIKNHLKNELTVLTGQSGVGKSTLLNQLMPNLQLETGEISMTLGRGRHTTRHVELIEVAGGYVADTPGFSSLDFTELEAVDLSSCFKEMNTLRQACKFRGCLHDKEPQCAIKAAACAGDIPTYRYDHYKRFLHEIMTRKPRY